MKDEDENINNFILTHALNGVSLLNLLKRVEGLPYRLRKGETFFFLSFFLVFIFGNLKTKRNSSASHYYYYVAL